MYIKLKLQVSKNGRFRDSSKKTFSASNSNGELFNNYNVIDNTNRNVINRNQVVKRSGSFSNNKIINLIKMTITIRSKSIQTYFKKMKWGNVYYQITLSGPGKGKC